MSANLLLSPCRLVGCWALVEQTPSAGRPRLYCTEEHRREADTMRKRVKSRLAVLREQIRRDEHLLAALGFPERADHIGGDSDA